MYVNLSHAADEYPNRPIRLVVPFVAGGVTDAAARVVADRLGRELDRIADIVYGSGYWLTASCHGLPDAGIVTFTQMQERMATLVRTSNAAVIADADTGYGGLLNVHHTVRGYEQAGVTAIQLEDQEFPKKCGHTPSRGLRARRGGHPVLRSPPVRGRNASRLRPWNRRWFV